MVSNNNNSVMKNVKNKDSNEDNFEYHLASKSRIFFAGIFDLIFSSIPTLIISIVFFYLSSSNSLHLNIYLLPSILIVVGFLWLVFYFIVIPYFFNGRTLCKYFFHLTLQKQNKQKIKLIDIIFREVILIFIPWLIGILSNLINVIILKINLLEIDSNNTHLFFFRLMTTFYFVWYLFIFFGILLDKKNQLFFDFKLKILIFKRTKKMTNSENNKKIISRNESHIHLDQMQPGNIDDDAIKELEDIESEI